MRHKDDPAPTPATDLEQDYYRTRALVQDAMHRDDANALDVAVSLHKDALAAIKTAHELSTTVDTTGPEPTHAQEASRGAA